MVGEGLHDLTLTLIDGKRQGAGGPKSDAGCVAGHFLPPVPGSTRHLEFGPRAPAAHPEQPEVAHGRPGRSRIGFEMLDAEAGPAEFERMPGTENPASSHHGTLHRGALIAARMTFGPVASYQYFMRVRHPSALMRVTW